MEQAGERDALLYGPIYQQHPFFSWRVDVTRRIQGDCYNHPVKVHCWSLEIWMINVPALRFPRMTGVFWHVIATCIPWHLPFSFVYVAKFLHAYSILTSLSNFSNGNAWWHLMTPWPSQSLGSSALIGWPKVGLGWEQGHHMIYMWYLWQKPLFFKLLYQYQVFSKKLFVTA